MRSMMWSNKTHISYNRVLLLLESRLCRTLPLTHRGCRPDCGLLYCNLPWQLILCCLNYLVCALTACACISALWCSCNFIVFICGLLLYFRFLFVLSLAIVVCHFYFFYMCILLLILVICLLLFHRGFHFAFLNSPLVPLGRSWLLLGFGISISLSSP